MDYVRNLPGLLSGADLLIQLARRHPLILTIATALVLFFLAVQSLETFISLSKWWKTWDLKIRLRAIICSFLLVVPAALFVYILNIIGRPQLIPLEPLKHSICWGRGVILKWDSPHELEEATAFSLEVRQGDKVELYESHRHEFPVYPLDKGFKQGDFDWRVRAADAASAWTGWNRVTFYRDRLSRISQEGILRVGLFADQLPPFAYYSSKNPHHVDGVEVRIGELLGRELAKTEGWPSNLKVQFELSQWLSGNVEALRSGAADVIIANTTRTDERATKYGILFSEPYLLSRLAFVWRKSAGVKEWKELASKRVATWEGSTAESVLRTFSASSMHYLSTPKMFEDLNISRIDAILDDEYVMRCEVISAGAQNYEFQVFSPGADISLDFKYPEEIAAYVLNDGLSNTLLEKINTILIRDDIKEEIKHMMETCLATPGCVFPEDADRK